MIVYLIVNRVNNKVYVGQTVKSLEWRWDGHLCDSRHVNKNTLLVDRAIAKYGKENFLLFTLCFASSQQELDDLETYYIKFFDARNLEIGYNLKSGGGRGKHHEVSIALMSKAQLERNKIRGTDSWITNGVKNYKLLPRQQMPEGYFYGKTQKKLGSRPAECIANNVASRKRNSKPLSAGTIKRLQTLQLGKKQSQETIAKRVRSIIRKRRRSHFRLCFICFKPFDYLGFSPERGICSRSCGGNFGRILKKLQGEKQ